MKTETLKKAIEGLGIPLEVEENWGYEIYQEEEGVRFEKVRLYDSYSCVGKSRKLEWRDDNGWVCSLYFISLAYIEGKTLLADGYFCKRIKDVIGGLTQ